MSLYETIDVWKRSSEVMLVRYRCFRNLATNKYSVQSADFYKVPIDPAETVNLERQFLELLAEESPSERSGEFGTLAEAIGAHDHEFKVL